MPVLRIASLLALALTTSVGCQDERPDPGVDLPPFAATSSAPGQAPALDSVTHIRVTSPRDDPRTRGFPSTITDPATIHNLVDFVERHHASWRPLSERTPQVIEGPIIFVDVFRGSALLATLAYRGPLELGIEGKEGHLFQVLPPSDASELTRILGAPIKVIAVPPRNTL